MDTLGFHYYNDSDHYQRKHLHRWLPAWKELELSWLVLQAPSNRAVPEFFLQGVRSAGIQPVLHFQLPTDAIPRAEDFQLLFKTYARWGVEHVILYDRPNLRTSWGADSWAQSGLVERFLDRFLPLAEGALQAGLTPVFPPLAPGGDYWDTMFLRAGLSGLQRRASKPLLKKLVLSAWAAGNGHSLNWGAGGPERWPEAQPYTESADTEDQRGFRIVDWYLTLSEAVLDKKLPVFMLGLGGQAPEDEDPLAWEMTMVRLLDGQEVEDCEPLPDEVLGGMFRLVPEIGREAESSGWYHEPGKPRPIVEAYHQLQGEAEAKTPDRFRFRHYLLLPVYDWGIADWHLEVTRSYIKKHRPTVGFSLQEAARAEEVTVLGGQEHFSEEDINHLRTRGCLVRRVEGDGTDIAAQLSAI